VRTVWLEGCLDRRSGGKRSGGEGRSGKGGLEEGRTEGGKGSGSRDVHMEGWLEECLV
jgi:hypothetical protein